jgi:hypothetical protein
MLFVVDAENAFIRNPSLALRSNEFSYPILLDKFEVFNFTHAIFCTIAFIQSLESVTWEFLAVAEIAGSFCACAHFAAYAGFGHVLFNVFAPVTGILIPQVGAADAAIHPARCD